MTPSNRAHIKWLDIPYPRIPLFSHPPHRHLMRLLAPLLPLTLFTALPLSAQSWQPTADTPGDVVPEHQSIASDGTHLYVLGTTGVYRSTDGSSWENLSAVAGTTDYHISTTPQNFIDFVNGEVWVGTDPGSLQTTVGFHPLHRLTPGATSWTRSAASGFPGGASASDASALVHDAASGNYIALSTFGGAYTSTDRSGWTRQTASTAGRFLFSKDGVTLASSIGNGLFRSSDGGVTWSKPAVPGGNQGNVASIGGNLIFPTSGANQNEAGTWLSKDQGQNWTRLTGPNNPVGTVFITGDGTHLFGPAVADGYHASNMQHLLSFSATGGVTWDPLPVAGLPKSATFLPSSADPTFLVRQVIRHGSHLYASGQLRTGASSFANIPRIYKLDLGGVNLTPSLQIAAQPAAANLLAGAPLQLEVVAGGAAPLTYQWKKNGADLLSQTASVLHLPSAAVEDTGSYTVTITDALGGAVTTTPAAIAVFPSGPGRYDPTMTRNGIGSTYEFGDLYPDADGSLSVFQANYAFRIGPDGNVVNSRGNFGGTGSSGPSYPVRLRDSEGRFVLFPKASPATNWRSIRRISGSGNFANDTTFPELIPTGTISGAVELPGRGYLVIGNITAIGGTTVNRVALISYDGTTVTPFAAAVPSRTLTSIHYSPTDDSVWIGGEFYHLDPPSNSYPWPGSTTDYLVKLGSNGELAAGWSPYIWPHASGRPTILGIQPDGRPILVENGKLARLNPDGTPDTTFNVAGHVFTAAGTASVGHVAFQPDGKLIVAGFFNAFGPHSAAAKFIRLNADGTYDDSFFSESGISSTAPVSSIAYDPRGFLYLAHATAASGATFQGVTGIGPSVVRVFASAATVDPGSPSEEWLASFTFPEGEGGWNDDPDKDGIPTILEYFLGSHPVQSTSGELPQENGFVTVDGQTYFTIRFVRSLTATDLDHRVVASGDLTFATNLGTTLVSETPAGAGRVEVVYRSNVPVSAVPAQFLRVEVGFP